MDYLKDIKNIKQVYSSELNEILVKTPPKIFRRFLIIVFGLIVICSLLAVTLSFEKTEEYPYVLNIKPNSVNCNEMTFYSSNGNLYKILNSKDIKISSSSSPNLSFTTSIDCCYVEKDIVHDGKIIDFNSQNLRNISDLNKLNLRYRYTLFINDTLNNFKKDEFILGRIQINLGKEKLYNFFD